MLSLGNRLDGRRRDAHSPVPFLTFPTHKPQASEGVYLSSGRVPVLYQNPPLVGKATRHLLPPFLLFLGISSLLEKKQFHSLPSLPHLSFCWCFITSPLGFDSDN